MSRHTATTDRPGELQIIHGGRILGFAVVGTGERGGESVAEVWLGPPSVYTSLDTARRERERAQAHADIDMDLFGVWHFEVVALERMPP